MKRIGLFLLCVVLLLCAAPLTASADTGPKPSVQVTFTGAEGETYYVTLLSKTESTGPWSVYNGSNEREWLIKDEADEAAFWRFAQYRDSGGYYFLQYFEKLSGNDTFTWGYYPPTPFKILVYFPSSDSFAVSGVYERYAFDSYFTVDLHESLTGVPTTTTQGVPTGPDTVVSGPAPVIVTRTTTTTDGCTTTTSTTTATDGCTTTTSTTTATEDTTTTSPIIESLLTATTAPAPLTATRSYDYTAELVSFAARVVLTIAIELMIAWLFRFRQKRQVLAIAAVNAATQLLLNGALSALWHYMGQQWTFWMLYLLLELLVFAVEAVLYTRLLKTDGERRHPVWYALAANVLSFAVGLLLAQWIPQLF